MLSAMWSRAASVRRLSTAAAAAASPLTSHVKTVGVVGAGQMGTGIALVAALNAKRNVVLIDSQPASLDKATKFIRDLLAKYVAKNKIDAATAQQVGEQRVRTATSMDELRDADFVIEAVSEDFGLKSKIFGQLDSVVRPGAILASNTSSISITKIASCTKRPEQVIGMHFMNPVPVMKLVEIIRGLATSQNTLDVTLQLAKEMDKETSSSADVPGFIANRLLMPYINEAIFALSEGVGTAEDIDKTMVLGTNVPMGPLKLADFIGLDTCLSIMQTLHRELGDSKYRPAPLLIKYVDARWLGKKSGRGFYQW